MMSKANTPPSTPDPHYSELALRRRKLGQSFGSGRQESPETRKRAVEECERLTWWAFKAGARPPGSDRLALIEVPQARGVRTWLGCPGCGRRASGLYRPAPGVAWLCRRCHGLCYLTQREHLRDSSMRRALTEVAEMLERTGGDWTAVLRETEGRTGAFLARVGMILRVWG